MFVCSSLLGLEARFIFNGLVTLLPFGSGGYFLSVLESEVIDIFSYVFVWCSLLRPEVTDIFIYVFVGWQGLGSI